MANPYVASGLLSGLGQGMAAFGNNLTGILQKAADLAAQKEWQEGRVANENAYIEMKRKEYADANQARLDEIERQKARDLIEQERYGYNRTQAENMLAQKTKESSQNIVNDYVSKGVATQGIYEMLGLPPDKAKIAADAGASVAQNAMSRIINQRQPKEETDKIVIEPAAKVNVAPFLNAIAKNEAMISELKKDTIIFPKNKGENDIKIAKLESDNVRFNKVIDNADQEQPPNYFRINKQGMTPIERPVQINPQADRQGFNPSGRTVNNLDDLLLK